MIAALTVTAWVAYTASAYHHGCVSPASGIEHHRQDLTASGAVATPNLTLAADPSIPFGTVMEISYRGKPQRWVVQDRGRSIKGRRVDLFLESCENARKFGRRTVWIRIVK
jgi:3D (Asp-Asp-Asp) domain-containing protein